MTWSSIHHYDHLPASQPAHDLLSTQLLSEPVHLVAANRRVQGTEPIDLREVAGHPWIAAPRSTACGEAVRHACHMAGFEPDVLITTSDFTLTAQLVAADHGLALLPELAIRTRADLVLRALRHPYRRITQFAARAGTYHHPNVQAVLTAVL